MVNYDLLLKLVLTIAHTSIHICFCSTIIYIITTSFRASFKGFPVYVTGFTSIT